MGDLEMQVTLAQSGPVQIELVQQFNDTPSVYCDLYGDVESGFHHMCTITDAYEETLTLYELLGFPVVAKIESSERAAYVDTREGFGFFSEVVEKTPGHMQTMREIATASANWVGKNPVRKLARAGYDLHAE